MGNSGFSRGHDGAAEVHQSWADIRKRYSEDIPGLSYQWMRSLIDHLVQSGKARHLYGFTSMHDLVISQTPPHYPLVASHLVVSPGADQSISFRYVDTIVERDQWQREVPGQDAVARLERFFRDLNWFGQSADVG